jgi:hypothetical protein
MPAFLFLLGIFSTIAWAGDLRVVAVTGEVLANGTPLQAGEELDAAVTLKTGNEGSVTLLLADKAVIELGNQTSLTIASSQEVAGSVLQLHFGRLRGVHPQKPQRSPPFEVKIQTALLVGRASEYTVHSERLANAGQRDRVTVANGQVEIRVENSSPFLIEPGKQWEATGRFVGSRFRVDTSQIRLGGFPSEATRTTVQKTPRPDSVFRRAVEVGSSASDQPGQGDSTLRSAFAALSENPLAGFEANSPLNKQGLRPPLSPLSVGILNAVDLSNAQSKFAAP